LLANFDLLAENIRLTQARLEEPEARRLPEVVIHCDYHPGNLKFSGEQVSALFDFDWSKVDLRAFDLALALWYFCTSWQGAQDGHLRLNWVKIFLDAYQKHLRAHPGIGPLSPAEIDYLPILINAGNLYVLNWTILDYYAKDVDPQEYLVFLQHSLGFTRWFETPPNRAELEAIVALACAG
jgi:homoserine kinase type II